MPGAFDVTSPASYAARFAAWDGGELAILAPRASPPGARLEGVFDGHALRLKVHRCRRRSTPDEPAEFLVIGRPLDLRRETREALDTLAAATPGAAVVARW
jgi:hypothetical protein